MKVITDLWAILQGDGIKLDELEAAALGAKGDVTISLWAAMEARHGVVLAHLVCLALYLVQWEHCRDQLAGVPMKASNYLRAIVLLILFAPFAALFWCVRQGWLRLFG